MDRLIAALEREAAERASQILDEARTDASRIREAAEREVGRERARLLERGETAARIAAARRRAEATRKAARSVLEARMELLDRVFGAARAALGETGRSTAYREALPRHLAEALRFFDGDAIVTCDPDLAGDVRKALRGRTDVEVRVDPEAPAGFAVRSADGRVSVEAGLAERLARRADGLAIEVLARLEGRR